MRDPRRIDDVLLAIGEVWAQHPDLRLGQLLLNAVHPAERLLEETYAFARNLIATVSPNSLRQTRWQVYRDLHRDVGASVRDSEILLNTMMREPDYAEGVAAFTQKRSPNWGGANE